MHGATPDNPLEPHVSHHTLFGGMTNSVPMTKLEAQAHGTAP